MRELNAHERKLYERLRRAYRRAGVAVLKRKGTMEDMKAACQRITEHAFRLRWLAK